MQYGGDYNPEQWSPDVWREDIARMREANVSIVTVGIFSWARIQASEGTFDWDWLDEVLGLLHDAGIAVDLATATASPPPWATAAYSGMLPRDIAGTVYSPGSRQHYAPTSPDYRRLAAELVRNLALRYAHHPAVRLWHVNNEYGCHLHYDYSDNALAGFRRWLEKRYGSLAKLNAAWGTAFWSQIYGSFEEVPLPRTAPYIHNPAAELDFRRFTSDALLELYVMERDIIRATGARQPITTNLMGAFPAADYWRWAPEMDVISDDTYPDPNDPDAWLETAFTRDLMRSLKPGMPWLVMEQATESANSRPTNAPKAPGQMAALSIQSVGRGADGIMFFQWRQSRRGAERFHSAMLPHAGTDTRIWGEVVGLGKTLRALPAMPAGPTGARIGLIFQWDSWWALTSADLPMVVEYERHARRWHSAAQRLNLAVDIVRGDEDLTAYDLVIAPSLFVVPDPTAAALRDYVAAGGRLLVTAFSDVVDADNAFREGGFTVSLRDVLGVAVVEFGALVAPGGHSGRGQDRVTVESPFGPFHGEISTEVLALHGADVIGRFVDGRTAGEPALTAHSFGKGAAHYLATFADVQATEVVLAALAKQSAISALLPAPRDVEVSRRGSYLTVINHGTSRADVPLCGYDAITGAPTQQLSLSQFDWAIVRAAEENQ